MPANVLDFIGLFHGIEVTPHLLHAASGRSNDAIEILEVVDKQSLSGGSVAFISTVGHGLPAACLSKWITHIQPESLQELERSYPNLGIDHVDVARYEKANSHALWGLSPTRCFGLCRHFYCLAVLLRVLPLIIELPNITASSNNAAPRIPAFPKRRTIPAPVPLPTTNATHIPQDILTFASVVAAAIGIGGVP